MNQRWEAYLQGQEPLPDHLLSWRLHGVGLDQFGVAGQPEIEPLPAYGPDELLVRVDAVGLCASDAKMVRIGNTYPLFHGRDLAANPARLGHEVALTVVRVGKGLQSKYYQGQRIGLQPDVFVNTKRLCFGVSLPGGLTQYVRLGSEVLNGDAGSYVFPIADELGYADVALSEPWACVEVAYTPRRRLQPLPGGTLWIRGTPGDQRRYQLSRPLASRRVVLTDVPDDLIALVGSQVAEIELCNGPEGAAFLEGTRRFDDIVLLEPSHGAIVAAAARRLTYGGTLTIVGERPLDSWPLIDVSRAHYEPTGFMGCSGPDISAAFGEQHNRSELRPGGVTWILGAGGPMGRMHTQRAIEMPDGPRAVLVTNRGATRLESLVHQFSALANAHGCELVAFSPEAEPGRLEREIERLTGGRGCDDIIVMVPQLAAIEQAARHLAPDGMLSLFAGLPPGNEAAFPLSNVYLHGAQITGTSGSTLADQQHVLEKARSGTLSPAHSVAAIAGLRAAHQGLQAVLENTYPGKVLIFPQLLDLPLLSLAALRTALPDVYACLGPNETWNKAAEHALLASRV